MENREESISFSFFDPSSEGIDEIVRLYCYCFMGTGFSKDNLEEVKTRIQKHGGYPGFNGIQAKDPSGKLIGFAYGYTCTPGQFYRAKLGKQLSTAEKEYWLKDCFEFVELAVEPSHRRLGVGESLHDKLLGYSSHHTSILTTQTNNHNAKRLYHKKRWEVVKETARVMEGSPVLTIMGKVLQ